MIVFGGPLASGACRFARRHGYSAFTARRFPRCFGILHRQAIGAGRRFGTLSSTPSRESAEDGQAPRKQRCRHGQSEVVRHQGAEDPHRPDDRRALVPDHLHDAQEPLQRKDGPHHRQPNCKWRNDAVRKMAEDRRPASGPNSRFSGRPGLAQSVGQGLSLTALPVLVPRSRSGGFGQSGSPNVVRSNRRATP
jgi:hypothetical protein